MIECNPILQYIENHPEFNITTLADACGIGRVTLSRIINRKQTPSPSTIRKLTLGTSKALTHSDLLNCYSSTSK